MKDKKYALVNIGIGLVSVFFLSAASANTFQKGSNEASIANGAALYVQACAACHGKNLEGATGFNLKDGVWVHGGSNTDILKNIRNGFPSKGMPGFLAMYEDNQLKDIVQFIRSKREGFEALRYRLYQMNDATDRDLAQSKLVKEGMLRNNVMDFELPEIQQYAIEFSGILHVPFERDMLIFADTHKKLPLIFYMNGDEVSRVADRWQPHWPVSKGTHEVRVLYYSADMERRFHNVPMFISDAITNIRATPLSTRGKQIYEQAQVPIKVESRARILRKKVLNLPSNTISVGFPSKVNIAFNTKECAFVGAWTGEFLNIGPNIQGRGKSPALPLGDWVYHFPEVMKIRHEQCRFIKVSPGEHPTFEYQLGAMLVKVKLSAYAGKTLTFSYNIHKAKNNIELVFPMSISMASVSASEGRVNGNAIVIPREKAKHFQIDVSFN